MIIMETFLTSECLIYYNGRRKKSKTVEKARCYHNSIHHFASYLSFSCVQPESELSAWQRAYCLPDSKPEILSNALQ